MSEEVGEWVRESHQDEGGRVTRYACQLGTVGIVRITLIQNETYWSWSWSRVHTIWGGHAIAPANTPVPKVQEKALRELHNYLISMARIVKKAYVFADKDTHTEHCCKMHGCKYGDDGCPVVAGKKKQSYPCEDCSP